ncbi:MAG: VRR-NUC domain-containing protein [Chroococcales cyanobacterium metabat2.561]|nr:MAG: VRR-NUC domain-containing protein [Chroococcales cyanobacterium metabat2.561]
MPVAKNLFEDVEGQSEDALQQKCFVWYNNTYPQYRGLLFHVPNGGARNGREAKKFSMLGVVAGVSDFIFLWRGKTHLIELKADKGRQSDDQINWMSLVTTNGFQYYIIRSLEMFKQIITYIMHERQAD